MLGRQLDVNTGCATTRPERRELANESEEIGVLGGTESTRFRVLGGFFAFVGHRFVPLGKAHIRHAEVR